MSAVPALLSGSGVGFTLGLIGGGGSILATPLLLYAVGIAQPHLAIGTGALAVAFAEGHSLPDAVAFACRAAALAVTRPGAQASLPTRPELAG